MHDWRAGIRKFVRNADHLSESLSDAFEVEPPSGDSWPESLPSCPVLAEFYAICDGGQFYPYEIYPLSQLEEETAEVEEWAEEGDDAGLVKGRWLIFGAHGEVNSHQLVWDAERDLVGLYSADNGWIFDGQGGWPLIPSPIGSFLDAMFRPSSGADDEVERDWNRLLTWLDRRE